MDEIVPGHDLWNVESKADAKLEDVTVRIENLKKEKRFQIREYNDAIKSLEKKALELAQGSSAIKLTVG